MLRNKIITSLLLFSLLIISCKQSTNYNFTLSGQITNAPKNTQAKLYLYLPTGEQLIDSTILNPDGKFTFKAKTNGTNFYYLKFSGKNYNLYVLADSGDHITVKADYNDLLGTYHVEGSKDSKLIQILEQHLYKTRKRLDSLSFVFEKYRSENKLDSAKIIDSLIRVTLKGQKEFSTDFVKKHHNSLAAIPALSQVYAPGKGVFSPIDDAELYFMVDSALGKKYPRNPNVLRLHSFVMNIKAERRRHQQRSFVIRENAPAPDFTIKTLDGQNITLSKISKPVLLVFWSTWCKSCVNTLELARSVNFDGKVRVITVCLSTDTAQINQFIAQHPDFKTLTISPAFRLWQEPIVKNYSVTKLPTSFLISKQKKIEIINPAFEDLRSMKLL